MKKTYNEIMHQTNIGSISVSARMYRFLGIRLGDFVSRQLRKILKED